MATIAWWEKTDSIRSTSGCPFDRVFRFLAVVANHLSVILDLIRFQRAACSRFVTDFVLTQRSDDHFQFLVSVGFLFFTILDFPALQVRSFALLRIPFRF